TAVRASGARLEDERAEPKVLEARVARLLRLVWQAVKRVREAREIAGRCLRIADACFQKLAQGARLTLAVQAGIVLLGELAEPSLRRASIDRSEQVGVVVGRDLRDRLHTLTLASLIVLQSKPVPGYCCRAAVVSDTQACSHRCSQQTHPALQLLLTPSPMRHE